MVSLKAKLNNSLQLRLSAWLSIVILVMAIFAGAFAFITTFQEVNEIQDDLLRQIASLFDAKHLPVPHHGDGGRLSKSDEESRVVVQYLKAPPSVSESRDGVLPLALPETLPDGIQTIEVEHEAYRVLVKTVSSGERIAIAQETAIRNEIAEAGALHTLIPFLILLPILLLTIAIIVRKLFTPITALSKEIELRREADLHPFQTEGLPLEIRSFVIAINRLLEKVSLSISVQQRFISDAAHELRSPLTALSLQAEHLSNVEMSTEAIERISMLRRGLERSRHLLNQLLEFARLQSTVTTHISKVSAKQVYRDVLEDLYPLAEAKKIDIGITDSDDIELTANETDLTILVRNLVDNAIRYTPEGGKIDLSIKWASNQMQLIVTDSGPGIPKEYRQRVMDPFYRLVGNCEVGSGLGLSIVKQIVLKMNGEIRLEYSNQSESKGLSVIVVLNMD
jgi:two-component system, OmpR family, sensor kinase